MQLLAEDSITHNRLGYIVMMLAACLVFALAKRYQPLQVRKQQLPQLDRILLIWAAFVGGAIGGKLPFLLFNPSQIFSIESWVADGKTITTGLVGGYVAVEIAKLLLKVKAKTGDAYAFPLAAALAIGRMGCFFNACCYGIHCELPWAWDFGDGPRHPTQIYEVIFHAAMACFLFFLPNYNWLESQRLKLYLIGYCLFRFTTEWIRPEPEFLIGLTFYQWVSLLFAIGLGIQWWVDEQSKRRSDEREESRLTNSSVEEFKP